MALLGQGALRKMAAQLAAIANVAHVAGLLAGCGTGLLGGALARSRQ